MLDLSREIARCDAEIAEIAERPDVLSGNCPAWLVVLGTEDWRAEKRLLLEIEATA